MKDIIVDLIMSSGGFSKLVKGRGEKALLSQAKRKMRELGYVFRIMDFLCRYKKASLDDAKFNIQCAKYFVEKAEHEDKTWKSSKIEKIWLQYRCAAPYIFTFYPMVSSRLPKISLTTEVIDALERLASDQRHLDCLIGLAAYAADILVGKARDVRIADFKNVSRVMPLARSFDSDELAIINSYDPKAPTA